MTTNKDKSIKEIYQLFESTSNLVLNQLDRVMKPLKEEGTEGISANRLEKLAKNERKIDENELKLDSMIVQTIVLYKPVASDLRRLFAVYRMINNLERIGDLTLKVANVIYKIQGDPFFMTVNPKLRTMLRQATKMVQSSLLSFVNKDVDLALATIKKDKELDQLNRSLLKDAIKNLNISAETSELLFITDIRSILSSIERIGDHATNIAEAAVYALSGSNIKHQDLS